MAGVPFNPMSPPVMRSAQTVVNPTKPSSIYEALLQSSARQAASDFNSSALSQSMSKDVSEAANSIYAALTAPVDAYEGRLNRYEIDPSTGALMNVGLMDAATNMAGLVQLGSMPLPRPSGSLGIGGAVRPSSSSNYVRNLAEDAPYLYREMNSEAANRLIENRLNMGPAGQYPLYWADTPDLALGQGSNTGIRMKMNADGVMGKGDFSSKPGLAFVKATGGGREFVSKSGVDFKKVDEVYVSPEINDWFGSADDRRLLNRLRSLVDAGEFTASQNGMQTVYQRIKT